MESPVFLYSKKKKKKKMKINATKLDKMYTFLMNA